MNTSHIASVIDRWSSRVDAVSDAAGATPDGYVPPVTFLETKAYTNAPNDLLMEYLLTVARHTGRYGRLSHVCASLQKAHSALLDECRALYMKAMRPKKYVKDEMMLWVYSNVPKFSNLQEVYVSKLIPVQGQIEGIAKECETVYKALSRIVELRKNQTGPVSGINMTSRRNVRR